MMKKIAFLIFSLFFIASFFHTTIPVEAKKPQPTPTPTRLPTPTPTRTPTPSPTPNPTPTLGVANLVLTVSAPTQTQTIQPILYTITITNLGPDPAHDVEFCSTLTPHEFALQGLDQGTWDSLVIGGASSRYPYCSVWGEETLLAVGSSVYMSYSIGESQPITKINTVETSSLDLDPDWANNSATVTTAVQ